MKWLILLTCLLGLGGCAGATPPSTVDHVDLARYAGTWYEIARLPHSFEKGCVGVTATYATRPDGKISVLNRCRVGTLTGELRSINGTARSTNPPRNSKLKVTFFWPFEGDYWILRLNPDYTTAAVGSPNRKTLWILHRQPTMDDSHYHALVESLKAEGFPTQNLERVPQTPHPPQP